MTSLPSRSRTKKAVQNVAFYDFRSDGYCDSQWKTNFSLGDGCIKAACDSLVIDSRKFTKTPDAGPNNENRANGWLDNNKAILYSRACFPVRQCHETVLDTRVASAQLFCVTKPVPDAFAPRIRNLQADPRPANGQVFFLQPETGLIFGFLITNQAIYAMYGRLPYARSLQGCSWALGCTDDRECVPCKTGCVTRYNCRNFWEDPRWRAFKLTASHREFIQFRHYISWRGVCSNKGYDHCNWKEYTAWCAGLGPIVCSAYPRAEWVRWMSVQDFEEYGFYYDWCRWRELEAEFGKINVCETKCNGSCASNMWADSLVTLSAAKATCTKDGCAACAQCVPGEVIVEKPAEIKRECYAYEWGTVRCCCDFKFASFLDLVEVARREACDPLNDFQCLSVGIDRSHSTIRWYHNNVEVAKHVGIGRRMGEEYRVRENGGYADDVDVTRVVAGFGTGSLLDASMPNNYNRYRALNNVVDATNLVPLLCTGAYFNPYHNLLGELAPVQPVQAFAVLGNTATQTAPGLTETSPEWRLFGQGAILRIEYLNIFTRTLPILPVYTRGKCGGCIGPIPANACGTRGCNAKDCSGGCCGKGCDAVDDNCCGEDISEDYVVYAPETNYALNLTTTTVTVPEGTVTVVTGATLAGTPTVVEGRLLPRENAAPCQGGPTCGVGCDDMCTDVSGLNLYV